MGSKGTNTGFTMVELVLVIAMMGVLTYVSWRWFSKSSFDVDFAFQQVKSALEFAQRKAIAANCPIQLTFTNTTIDLKREDDCDGVDSFTSSVPPPDLAQATYDNVPIPNNTKGPPVVEIDPDPGFGVIVFDGLGRINGASNQNIQIRITENGATRRTLVGSSEFGVFRELP